jgi:serine/threonine-protein kinase
MIHKLAPDGTLLDAFGVYGMSSGELLQPVATAVIPDDSVLVLDSETHLVQRFSHDGEHLSSFGGRGTGNGLFNNPRDLCVGPDGSVYVLDYGNRQIQEFTVDGIYATRWAFFVDSEQDRTRLLDGLTVDKSGNLYVSDVMGGRVRLISPEGKVVRSYPIESVDGDPKDTLIDLGVDVNGILYAVRRGGHLIRKLGRDSKLLDSIEVYSPVMNMIVNAQ